MSDNRREEGSNPRPRARRTAVDIEEDRTWSGFYREVTDPTVAGDLVQYLDAHPNMRDRCPGLYIKAKQSIRHGTDRNARIRRVAHAVRTTASWLFVKPVAVVGDMLRFAGRVVLETLPSERKNRSAPAARPAQFVMSGHFEQPPSQQTSPDVVERTG